MNLEQYLSFVCLAQSQSPQKCIKMEMPITQEEQNYHYLVLKRWTTQYEQKNNINSINNCECKPQTTQNDHHQVNHQGYYQPSNHLSQQSNKKIGEIFQLKKQECILGMFLKRIKTLFEGNRAFLSLILKKYKLSMSFEDLQSWIEENLAQCEVKDAIKHIRTTISLDSDDEKSLFLRVLLKNFIDLHSRSIILSQLKEHQHDLNKGLAQIRRISKKIFKKKL